MQGHAPLARLPLLMLCILLLGCGRPGTQREGIVHILATPSGSSMGWVAFVMRQGTVNHLSLTRVDATGKGSQPLRLTDGAEAENYPSWSPDGQRLVYQRDVNGSAIYVIDLAHRSQ